MFKTSALPDLPILGPVPAKATLFAAPVLIHPQLAREDFPACPVLPSFETVYNQLGTVLAGPQDDQSYLVLDRIVSPSFLASILDGNEMQMTSFLVCGHVLEQEDPLFTIEDWICDEGIEASKGVIGFLVGAAYRQEEDPEPITLIEPGAWMASTQRKRIEAVLSGGSSLQRHQVLAPCAIADALFNGFEGLCRMHLNFHGGDARVDANLMAPGHVVLSVHAGRMCTEFELGANTLSSEQVERLLRNLNGLRHSPFRLPPQMQADDAWIIPTLN